jgi:hypothetical protein
MPDDKNTENSWAIQFHMRLKDLLKNSKTQTVLGSSYSYEKELSYSGALNTIDYKQTLQYMHMREFELHIATLQQNLGP